MHFRFIAVTAAFAFGVCLAGEGCGRPVPPQAVATVDGVAISAPELDNTLRATSGPKILQRLIEQQLILGEAAKEGIKLDESELAKQGKELQESHPRLQTEVFMKELRSRMFLRQMVLNQVTEAEKRKFYDEFKRELESVEVSVIRVPDKDTATQVRVALDSGTDFSKVAATSSTDVSTKRDGGKLGELTRRQLARVYGDPAAKAVFALAEGGTSAPLELDSGVIVFFKVTRRLNTYDTLLPVVEEIFFNSGRDLFLRQLFARANIESPFLRKENSGVAPPGPVDPAQAPSEPKISRRTPRTAAQSAQEVNVSQPGGDDKNVAPPAPEDRAIPLPGE